MDQKYLKRKLSTLLKEYSIYTYFSKVRNDRSGTEGYMMTLI